MENRALYFEKTDIFVDEFTKNIAFVYIAHNLGPCFEKSAFYFLEDCFIFHFRTKLRLFLKRLSSLQLLSLSSHLEHIIEYFAA